MFTTDEKNFSMIAHITAIFTGVLGPIIIYILKKDESKFIAFHALQAACLQGIIFILGVIGFILSVITLGLGLVIVIPVIMIASLGALVLHIVAAVKLNGGEDYKIPIVSDFAAKQIPGYLPPN